MSALVGCLPRYMDDNPQSHRRIQEELRDYDLLAGGKPRRDRLPRGMPVDLLLERGELEQYMNEAPESHRRIQGEMRGLIGSSY